MIMNDRSQSSLKPTRWRVRPYEGKEWRITTLPPTDEKRRWLEYELIEDGSEASGNPGRPWEKHQAPKAR